MKCTKHKFKCGDGQCIPKAWLCDKEPDCDDKSDESLERCGKFASQPPPAYFASTATSRVTAGSETVHQPVSGKPWLLDNSPALVGSVSLAAVVCAVILLFLYKWKQKKNLNASPLKHISQPPTIGVDLNDYVCDSTGCGEQTSSEYETMDPIVNPSDAVYESIQYPIYQQLAVQTDQSIAVYQCIHAHISQSHAASL
ncbi:low-density lipoprotein receptor class A domain-containing protein 3-like isoform X1 [Alosa alosa]|uniref:low-density lipoprotein receptor class A domain-containing protein 3-like isoform X1 n=1 Tax=Alosa alosa TaxID=278164 RepID=UPI0020152C36|nr:low-density lipoprotein receptor class A domain-containing protein 3-like isoform X1 [Alosa alosa]